MESSTCPKGLISRGEEVRALVAHLKDCEAIAVDAEMDSFFSYQTKLCLIQISSPDEDFLIDPLADVDLSPLREVFEDPAITKVLHAADNDVPFLVERVGGKVVSIFDTHTAARLLGLPKSSLGGLLQEFLGLEVDKTFQRADWRVRPLPEAQLEYARGDTRYLVKVHDILKEMLQSSGLEVEAEAGFLRTNQNPPAPREFNALGYLNVPEARRLSRHHKARLRDLYRWRDDLARKLDAAVFRVLPEGLLIPLCLFDGTPRELQAQFRHGTIQKHAAEIVHVLAEAVHQPFQNPSPSQLPDTMLRGQQLRRFESLRKWRNQLAQELGYESERVFSNRLLKGIVVAQPKKKEDLSAIPGLEEWRLEKFGEQLWQQLQSI